MLGELPGLLLLVLVTLKTALVTESKAPSGSPCEKGSSARVTQIQFPIVSSSKLKKSDA